MGKSAPPTPDYVGAAQAQGQSSQEVTNTQSWANRPNVTTPWGTQTWDTKAVYDPATGQPVTQWNQNVTLTPAEQASLDAQQKITGSRSDIAQGLLGSLAQQEGQGIDYKGVEPITGMTGDPGAFYNKAGDAVMSQFNRYQAPIQAQQKSDLVAQLNGQGLKPGDAAYDRAMTNLQNQQDQQTQGAEDQATQMSANVGNQMFQNTQSETGFNNQVHMQQIAEQMQRQGFSLNQINALLNGQQVNMPNSPGFNTAGSGQPVNYTGAAQNTYGADLNATNAQNAQVGQDVSTAAMIAAMYFSDRRLKTGILLVGKGSHGHNIYEFRYLSDPPNVKRYGVMSDEVNPDAVHVDPATGFDVVDYGALK